MFGVRGWGVGRALACSATQAFALSVLERHNALRSDGATPTTSDVIGDCHHAWRRGLDVRVLKNKKGFEGVRRGGDGRGL